jgi:hydrogenase nickel incorporation protein HypA/HybF
MHEFPEVQALLRQILAQAPPDVRITRVKMVVGEASGHDPHHIEQHFREASRGTSAEGAVLEFVTEPLAAHCAACGEEYKTDESSLGCPRCGGTRLVFTAGKSVYLAGVELDLLPYPQQHPKVTKLAS